MIMNPKFLIEKKFNKKGFTLIEMMTAVAIFALIMTISMGSILGIFDANRKSQSLKTIIDNLNFTLDTMSREIRFGKNYHCENVGTLTSPRSCPLGDSFVSFLSSENKQVVYRLTGNRIEKSINGGASYIEVTAPEATITGLKMIVLGAEAYPGDTAQPRVFMQVSGYAGSKLSSRTTFSIQTIVTQRYPDGQI